MDFTDREKYLITQGLNLLAQNIDSAADESDFLRNYLDEDFRKIFDECNEIVEKVNHE